MFGKTKRQEFQFYQPSSEPIFYDREQGPIYEFIEPFVDLGAPNFTPKVVVGDLDMNNTAISTIRTVLWDHSDSLTIEHLIYEQLVGTFITLERFGARDNDTQLLHLRNSDDPDFIKHTTTFGRAITTRPLKGMHDYIKEIGKENRHVCFKELIVSSPSTVYNEYSDVYKEGREVIWEKFRERLFKTLGIKQIEPLKNVLFIRDTNITNYNETIHYLQSRFNEFNFTLADIGNHSIEEQLELVSKYSIIVGSQLVPFMHQKSCAIIPDTILRNYEDDHVGLKYFWNYFTVRKLYYQMIDDKFDFERIEHLFHTAITELEISTQDGNTLNLADEKRNVH
ncbi:hypothetical protein HK103_002618 [Boothiomyces macroporosus]|uniref:Glycosyltransferase 61 catalytic domain-containing protein n=1 Tax=Boothiomyces macroporosus TaxID=261099 RepID=A0AAD5Y2G1_9FUNG|nr:hypothetical protein HK103_002618 [Boothiomyces macroporosus]